MRFILALLLAIPGLLFAESRKPRSEAEEAEYSSKISARATSIVEELALKDAKAGEVVREALLVQYRALDQWQRENEAKAKALKKESHAQDKDAAQKAKADLDELYAKRKLLRETFLARLSVALTPDKVEQVKDLMTYHKVRITFNAYCQQNPGLKEEHKEKILAWLKEAREEAIDGGSSEEKSDIFNKYKGRINNYLSKEGFGKKKK